MNDDEKKRRYRYLQLKQKAAQAGNFDPPAVSGQVPQNPGQVRTGGNPLLNGPILPIAGGLIGTAMAGPGPGSLAGYATAEGLMSLLTTGGAAALGGGAGEGYRQLLSRLAGEPAPDTVGQAAKGIGEEAATQGIASMLPIEKLGGAALRGTGKLISKIPFVGPGMDALASGVKKTAGDLFYLGTKVDPKNAATLYENPSAIFPGRMKDARAGWRAAAENAGIPVDDVSPEIINALKGDAEKTVFDVFERLQAGDAVSAAEAQTANEALRLKVMPAAVNDRNRKLVQLYSKMGDKFRERIGQESPELAAANKEYAIASAGKKFRTVFPQNKSDTPAWVRTVAIPSLTLGAGFQRNKPLEGALQGLGVMTLGSPLALGAGIAMAGGARYAMPYVGRAAKASLAELLKDELKGK